MFIDLFYKITKNETVARTTNWFCSAGKTLESAAVQFLQFLSIGNEWRFTASVITSRRRSKQAS